MRAAVGLVVLALIGAGGCRAQSDETFWTELRLEGAEVEHYESFQEMAIASDLLAIGTFQSPGTVRMLQGDAEEDQIFYAQFRFVPSEARAEGGSSEAYPSDVQVEFLIPASSIEQATELVEDTLGTPPDTRSVVLLRAKQGRGETGLYRLVNSSGLWDAPSGQLRAPLASDQDDAHDLLHSVGEADSLEELYELLTGSSS